MRKKYSILVYQSGPMLFYLNEIPYIPNQSVTNYNKVSNYICDAAKLVAETSMNEAVMELKKSSTNIFDIGVTVDGTWQRRGFSSMNGVVGAISVDYGKIMDLEPLSRYCKQCCKSLQDNEQGLVAWKTSHQEVCKLNFSGTAPVMEPEGAKRIFERSIQKRG